MIFAVKYSIALTEAFLSTSLILNPKEEQATLAMNAAEDSKKVEAFIPKVTTDRDTASSVFQPSGRELLGPIALRVANKLRSLEEQLEICPEKNLVSLLQSDKYFEIMTVSALEAVRKFISIAYIDLNEKKAKKLTWPLIEVISDDIKSCKNSLNVSENGAGEPEHVRRVSKLSELLFPVLKLFFSEFPYETIKILRM